MTGAAEDVYRLAAALRRRHGEPGEKVTFTHVPVLVPPAKALDVLRSSTLKGLLFASGALLNTPTPDWYVPVLPVRADDSALVEVGVTASTWEPPSWGFTAAELTVRLVYAADGKKASQELRMHAAAGKSPSLSRWTYDHQRAETGYEGERPMRAEPDAGQLRDMLALVRQLTGEAADST